MATITAIVSSWLGALGIGTVIGHFFGDLLWQPVKHGLTSAYQWVKHKIVG